MIDEYEERNYILQRDFCQEFIRLMQNRIVVSHYKYGWVRNTYPDLAQAYKCIEERLELYKKTHNTEYLIDVANFAMIEFVRPSFEDAEFVATDSDKSPGLAGGISQKKGNYLSTCVVVYAVNAAQEHWCQKKSLRCPMTAWTA